MSFDFARSGHNYGSPFDGGYGGDHGGGHDGYGGYGGGYGGYGPYGGGYGGYGGGYGGYGPHGGGYGGYDGYDPAQSPWLAPATVTYGNGATGYAFPQMEALGGRLPPVPGGAATESANGSFLSHLIPSSARIGLRRGVATEEDGDDGTTWLPPVFSNEISSPQGPYYAVEGGLGWNGNGTSTDLALRMTLASGDEEHAGGGIAYQAELSQRIRRGPVWLAASLQGAFSRSEQPSHVDSELYAAASVYASYTLDWLTFHALAYGVRQQTRYSEGEPYASSYGNLQLGAQMTFDEYLPAAWRRSKAPPYLRLRGYYERIYAGDAYVAGLTDSAGMILVGGVRF